uniref:Expressed protein n=1 Tax=Oryza sativa subsp. japonica TaxID=39947 RepID=Q2RBM1_ORYSJ|nr:expressed protein [Oryza sativa Japonica Group]
MGTSTSSPSSPPPSPTAGLGTRSSAYSTPRFPPAPTSPRCSTLAHPPAVCCARPPPRHSPPSPIWSCLAMRYEALLLRQAKYSDDLHLQVSNEEWLTFAKDSLDNGFYTIASKAFANALLHIDPSHPGYLDSTNSILKKDKINDISGLQNLAKSLSARHSEKGLAYPEYRPVQQCLYFYFN